MSSRPLIITPPSLTPDGSSPAVTSSTKFSPSPHKLALLIDESKSVRHLRQIHAVVVRRNLNHHPILNFKLQRSYSSLGRLDFSLSLFKQTPEPNIFLYTNIINTLALRGFDQGALLLYIQMLNQGVEPNEFTFSSVLKSCSIGIGEVLHCQVIKHGFDSDLYVQTGLVDVYAKGGNLVSARQVFDRMPEKSLVSLTTMMTCYAKHGELDNARKMFDRMVEKDAICWNVMIDGYTQQGMPKQALELFQQMLSANVKPNEVTVISALSACGQLGSLDSGRWLHSYVKNHRIDFNVRVATALIDMYSKCGNLEDARLVFDGIKEKDAIAWNSMIVGYATHGFGEEALELFTEMDQIGLQPTDITFIGILNACAHAGMVDEGYSYFHIMKERYKIEPKIEHYGCMVNLLGRAGKLEEAYGLVKDMKIEPDPVLWGALLGACRLHGNLALGEEVAEFLVTHNIANSGTYVLLSNMYASSGNWEGVARVRTLMRDSGIEKEPGGSLIEVDSKVHEFVAGDRKHPKSREIYMMLEEMKGWVKACGYNPQTDTVLHDIGEMQKEQSLAVHSEKLALAFGLLSTKPGTVIKIVKNLRVCSDCHAAFKLLSKITGRKLVMRDRNRFHHFVDGVCSCKDYW